ncbi:hypothetical protein PC116_g11998 [Phytophthora cactorum]|uniref:Uncharacterized protein n=2 Tax=Phytophthora TaxID=4783 RepID=A0A8T1CJM2_9STRA|nr:hypothetical protein PC111_g7611 [Phytophthora cactorum]KAG6971618.1 hypothetical protein JG688_00004379 [Phytophthora aleatoria]KAG2911107.1 hypothetical protein PC114_g9507 [Phytophthora cactorum]KAG2925979.1 hypothetical protein PC115_g8054 [Phytophthora cactorum]KAG2943714.1 hypothetical protein PC117_g9325 [Phytophthora cactorum]
MSPIAVWHWQERFEPVNVEDACRRQILKIRKSKSYNLWLKEKSRANSKQSHVQEPGYDDDNQGRQAEIDAAFRDWLRQKQTSKKQKNAVDTKPNLQCKPWCKPPSLHVNLKTKKGSTRKAEHASITKANTRVRLEDRVRRTQRRDELDRLEKQQREKHKITWRKKVAVCAYSTLAVYS